MAAWARSLACWARATSISLGRSAVSARMVTLSGRTSANPQATANRCSVAFSRYVISPTESSVIRGACPGSTPRYPFFPGISTSWAVVSTTRFSGVTISSLKVSAIGYCSSVAGPSRQRLRQRRTTVAQRHLLRCRLHLLRSFEHLLDLPLHVEGLLGDVVVLAFNDCFESFHRVGDFHVASLRTGKLLGHMEGLREETLNLAGTRNRELLIFAQFVDTENGDDILQIFVRLQRLLHRLGYVIMLLANNARIENARGRSQWIDGRINSDLGQGARKHGGGVEVSESRGWSRIGQVVGRHVNRLY